MVNVVISTDPKYLINRNIIESAVLSVLKQHKVTSGVEVEVLIVGDRKMHELNKKYRELDSTTDILTFALENPSSQNLQHIPRIGFVSSPDKVLRLGSIVISHPQAVEDAALDEKSLDDEIAFLVEHGTKHLLGYHHS